MPVGLANEDLPVPTQPVWHLKCEVIAWGPASREQAINPSQYVDSSCNVLTTQFRAKTLDAKFARRWGDFNRKISV